MKAEHFQYALLFYIFLELKKQLNLAVLIQIFYIVPCKMQLCPLNLYPVQVRESTLGDW
jgi:hypothetical protein